MKTVLLTLEDSEYKFLYDIKVSGKKTWKKLILDKFEYKEEK